MVGRAICLQVGNWFETRFSPRPHLIHHNSEDAEDGGAGSGKIIIKLNQGISFICHF
jgi:hypothetical protein